MNNKVSYTYMVLRYVHDVTTGEFVNVGVAMHAPDARFVGALCRNTYGRLNKVFPGVNADHFKSLMRHIQAQFERFGERLSEELPLHRSNSVEDFARTVLPADDSSLQWSPAGSGRTSDPSATLEKLFDRMVMRYEDRSARERRGEEDVWRHFKRTLEARQLLRYFEPHTIAVPDDELEFKHTWKNGVLHCLEPVSFDLATPESIHDKAHRWLGRINSISTSHERFRLYFLVGAPQDESLGRAYERAISILGKAPVEKAFFAESEAEQLARLVASEVEGHERATMQ
ncbi:MAG: DUF3037 domain-containing protein [Xanthomonadales bacterium]|nr:DUF3037 domain-containing protein [Xanthomonadales bacterium]MCB1641389.1 DUF3037 domain-containing protein [Xanthomonadales bacterium]